MDHRVARAAHRVHDGARGLCDRRARLRHEPVNRPPHLRAGDAGILGRNRPAARAGHHSERIPPRTARDGDGHLPQRSCARAWFRPGGWRSHHRRTGVALHLSRTVAVRCGSAGARCVLHAGGGASDRTRAVRLGGLRTVVRIDLLRDVRHRERTASRLGIGSGRRFFRRRSRGRRAVRALAAPFGPRHPRLLPVLESTLRSRIHASPPRFSSRSSTAPETSPSPTRFPSSASSCRGSRRPRRAFCCCRQVSS